MTLPEYISRGLNKFRADLYNELFRDIEEWRRLKPFIESLRRERQGGTPDPSIWIRLRGNRPIAGADNRWEYAWKQVAWNVETQVFEDMEGGLHSGAAGEDFETLSQALRFESPAFNTIEDQNASTGVVSGGVNLDGADYPDGFCLRPIANAVLTCSQVDSPNVQSDGPVVRATMSKGLNGGLVILFAAMNQHDGTCELAQAATDTGALSCGFDLGFDISVTDCFQ